MTKAWKSKALNNFMVKSIAIVCLIMAMYIGLNAMATINSDPEIEDSEIQIQYPVIDDDYQHEIQEQYLMINLYRESQSTQETQEPYIKNDIIVEEQEEPIVIPSKEPEVKSNEEVEHEIIHEEPQVPLQEFVEPDDESYSEIQESMQEDVVDQAVYEVPETDLESDSYMGQIQRLLDLGIVLPDFDWGTTTPKYYPELNLSYDLQLYTLEVCTAYGIGDFYELVLAKMYRESSFRYDALSKTNDYGISQINKCNHGKMRSLFGITDFMDPYQSILCGVHILANWSSLSEHGDAHRALVSYNTGSDPGAGGQSGYSRNVVSTWQSILSTGSV